MSDLLTSKLCPQRLLVTLTDTPDDGLTVRSCEIIGASFRNRTSFGEGQSLWAVFNDGLADALNEAVSRLSKSSELIVLPEFVFEMPGLVLGGLNIMVADLADQGRQIICRFKHFIGSLNSAFHPNIAISPTIPDYRQRLLTQTLSDIAIPLYNLCKATQFSELSAEKVAPISAAKNALDEKSHELGFYMELLKRYVEETSKAAQSEQIATPSTSARIMGPPSDTHFGT